MFWNKSFRDLIRILNGRLTVTLDVLKYINIRKQHLQLGWLTVTLDVLKSNLFIIVGIYSFRLTVTLDVLK